MPELRFNAGSESVSHITAVQREDVVGIYEAVFWRRCGHFCHH